MTRFGQSLGLAAGLLSSLLAGSALATPLAAQATPPKAEDAPGPIVFSTGVSAGAMRFSGGRSQQGVSAILLYRPAPWLTFSVTPGFARTSLGDSSNSGLTDIPLSAGASYEISDAPWSPSLSGGLGMTISPASGSTGLGLGRGTYSVSGAVSASPTDGLYLAVGASQPLSSNSGNGSIDLESAWQIAPAMASLGLTAELGRADSGAVLSRSLAGGIMVPIMGRVALSVDGSAGLTSGAPSWTFSVGVGTAFAGHSPLSPSSALRRIKRVFGAKAGSTSGFTGKGTANCKKSGTC